MSKNAHFLAPVEMADLTLKIDVLAWYEVCYCNNVKMGKE